METSKLWLRRSTATLSNTVNGMRPLPEDPTADHVVTIEASILDVETRLGSFDNSQGELELVCPDIEVDQCVTEAADFREECAAQLLEGKKLLAALKYKVKGIGYSATSDSRGSAHDVNSSDGSIAGHRLNAKLPQIHLPKFDGDLTKWQTFWDQYKAVIHDQDTLPTVSKFTYLTSLLSGEARNVVAGLSVTEANYGIACKLLTERYGRPERIIFSHIQALLSLQALNNSSKSSKQRTSELWQLQDTLLSHVRSLESLGIKGDTYGMFLTPVVLSRLPQDIRLEWAREGEGNEANLTFLLEFLSKEIKRRERSEVFRDNSAHTTEIRPLSEEKPAYNTRRRPAAAALHVSAPHSARPPARPTHSRRPQCAFCDEAHPSHNCPHYSTPDDRRKRVGELRLCYRCLAGSHFTRNCVKGCTCHSCGGAHHQALCHRSRSHPRDASAGGHNTGSAPVRNADPATRAAAAETPPLTHATAGASLLTAAATASSALTTPDSKLSALPTVELWLPGRDGSRVKAVALFDSGADRSYISASLARKIQSQVIGTTTVNYTSFGGATSPECVSNIHSLTAKGTETGSANLTCVEIPKICAPMLRPTIPPNLLHHFSKLNLVNSGVRENEPLVFDVLIGLDQYWHLVSGGTVVGKKGLVAQETVFGWMVSGSW